MCVAFMENLVQIKVRKRDYHFFIKQEASFSVIAYKRDTNLRFVHLGWYISWNSDHISKFLILGQAP